VDSTHCDLSHSSMVKKLAVERDAELVNAARAGSTSAFAELQGLYSHHLYRTIFSITKNREDTEDALQETFLRAYLALGSFEGRSTFYSWLTRIAINSALMSLRRHRARPEVSVESLSESNEDSPPFEIVDPGLNPEQICDQSQRCVKMMHAIRKLEPSLRTAIQLQLRHHCSVREIAQALDISAGAVKARLYRARRRLTAVCRLKGLETRSRSSSSGHSGPALLSPQHP
jgi:RNA polymerase sigma-70 factor, ECF subfamily